MRRADIALACASLALVGCAALPAAPSDRAMFRDTRLSMPAAMATLTTGRSTRAEVQAQLGEADRLPFDNGNEVWVYRARPLRAGQPELVLLFGAEGVLKKLRANAGNAAITGTDR